MAGVPPRRGRIIRANIGWTMKSRAADSRIVTEKRTVGQAGAD